MKPRKNRRAFMKTAAAAVTAPLLGGAAAGAQEPAKTPLESTARALTAIVRARHGRHLSEDQLKVIQQSIARSQATAEVLKRMPLENGDEPAFAFNAEEDSH
jgi:hypothetical protein